MHLGYNETKSFRDRRREYPSSGTRFGGQTFDDFLGVSIGSASTCGDDDVVLGNAAMVARLLLLASRAS